MARINVEDSIFKDGRFQDLMIKLGSKDTAMGAVVRAWMLAQKYWVPYKKGIPRTVFIREGISWALVEVGLAKEVDADFIYMAGSEEQFSWLISKYHAGKCSGEARRVIIDEKVEHRSTHVEQQRTSSLSSLSLSKNLRTEEYKSPEKKTRNPRSSPSAPRCEFDLDQIYQQYPRKIGKSSGMKKLAREIRSSADYDALRLAIVRFNQHHVTVKTEPGYLPYFSTFVSSWRDWTDPSTGAVGTIDLQAEQRRRREEAQAKEQAEYDTFQAKSAKEWEEEIKQLEAP